jgi:hypothetical protein
LGPIRDGRCVSQTRWHVGGLRERSRKKPCLMWHCWKRSPHERLPIVTVPSSASSLPVPPKCFQQEVAVFVVRSRSKASSLNPLAYRGTAKSIRKHIARSHGRRMSGPARMCGVAHGVSVAILHHLHGQRLLQRRTSFPGRDRSQGPGDARRRAFVLHVLPLTLKASRRGLGLQRPCSQGCLKDSVYDGMLGLRMASIHAPCH